MSVQFTKTTYLKVSYIITRDAPNVRPNIRIRYIRHIFSLFVFGRIFGKFAEQLPNIEIIVNIKKRNAYQYYKCKNVRWVGGKRCRTAALAERRTDTFTKLFTVQN